MRPYNSVTQDCSRTRDCSRWGAEPRFARYRSPQLSPKSLGGQRFGRSRQREAPRRRALFGLDAWWAPGDSLENSGTPYNSAEQRTQ